MYAAKDGNVYKNTGSGWQSYNNGSWNSANAQAQQARSSANAQAQQDRSSAASAQQRAPTQEMNQEFQNRQRGAAQSQQFQNFQRSGGEGGGGGRFGGGGGRR